MQVCSVSLLISCRIDLHLHLELLSLTLQSVTVVHFTLPITCLLINVESQSRGATDLLYTRFCAPDEENK